mmetsp:Transcript_86528/g.173130  ORF Transcript_86528/g.173130 Transcript_86528/m.173130 type:complete len:227 (+) Transcript_86528:379-1059(+)
MPWVLAAAPPGPGYEPVRLRKSVCRLESRGGRWWWKSFFSLTELIRDTKSGERSLYADVEMEFLGLTGTVKTWSPAPVGDAPSWSLPSASATTTVNAPEAPEDADADTLPSSLICCCSMRFLRFSSSFSVASSRWYCFDMTTTLRMKLRRILARRTIALSLGKASSTSSKVSRCRHSTWTNVKAVPNVGSTSSSDSRMKSAAKHDPRLKIMPPFATTPLLTMMYSV